MANWYEESDVSGNYLSCKEGQRLVVTVKEIKKVVGDKYSKWNYKRKDGSSVLTKEENQPFHHELIADDDRVLTIGSLSLMGALRSAQVIAGDKIELSHPGRGKYEVKRFNDAPDENFEDGKNLPF